MITEIEDLIIYLMLYKTSSLMKKIFLCPVIFRRKSEQSFPPPEILFRDN